MKRIVLGLVVGFALLVGGVGASYADADADFRRGWAAYQQKDYKEAAEWYRKAAEQGDAAAQYNLGLMYYKGQGVTQDYKQAVVWYRKAVEQGLAEAQNNLGVMYWVGQGVIKDIVYAHMWSNIASANGHKKASEVRNMVEKIMTSAQIAEAQKLARECVRKKYKGC